VVSFTPRPLYPQGKSPQYPLDRRQEHRLRVFVSRVLRRIFVPKREETGSWRKLHNDELYSLYSSLNIIRVIK
jgi:hypothetical protein